MFFFKIRKHGWEINFSERIFRNYRLKKKKNHLYDLPNAPAIIEGTIHIMFAFLILDGLDDFLFYINDRLVFQSHHEAALSFHKTSHFRKILDSFIMENSLQ